MKTNNINKNLTNNAVTGDKNNNNFKNLKNQAVSSGLQYKVGKVESIYSKISNNQINLARFRVISGNRLSLNKKGLKTRVLNLKETCKNLIKKSKIDSSNLKKNSAVISLGAKATNINKKGISVAPLKVNSNLLLNSNANSFYFSAKATNNNNNKGISVAPLKANDQHDMTISTAQITRKNRNSNVDRQLTTTADLPNKPITNNLQTALSLAKEVLVGSKISKLKPNKNKQKSALLLEKGVSVGSLTARGKAINGKADKSIDFINKLTLSLATLRPVKSLTSKLNKDINKSALSLAKGISVGSLTSSGEPRIGRADKSKNFSTVSSGARASVRGTADKATKGLSDLSVGSLTTGGETRSVARGTPYGDKPTANKLYKNKAKSALSSAKATSAKATDVKKTNLFDVYTSVKETSKKVSELRRQNKNKFINPLLQPANPTAPVLQDRGPRVRNYIKKLSKFDPALAKSQQLVYNFVSNKNKPLQLNSFLVSSFLYLKSIISKPIYEITPNDVTINLFYYNNFRQEISLSSDNKGSALRRGSVRHDSRDKAITNKRQNQAVPSSGRAVKATTKVNNQWTRWRGQKNFKINKNILAKPFNFNPKLKKEQGYILYFKNITKYLSKLLNTKIQFDLTRLKTPNLESQISAVTIGLISNVIKGKFRRVAKRFFRSTRLSNARLIKNKLTRTKRSRTIFSVLSGVNIKLGGRLISQKIIPKRTSTIIQKGKLNRGVTSLITTNRFTSKSNRGAFSVTVTMGHKFF
jgi:hypothetical protein